MSQVCLTRRSRNSDVVVSPSVASATSVSVGDVAGGVAIVAGVTAAATLTVWGSNSASGPFVRLHDAAGGAAVLAIPADGGAVALPDSVFGLQFMRLTSSEDLGTSAAVVVSLKT